MPWRRRTDRVLYDRFLPSSFPFVWFYLLFVRLCGANLWLSKTSLSSSFIMKNINKKSQAQCTLSSGFQRNWNDSEERIPLKRLGMSCYFYKLFAHLLWIAASFSPSITHHGWERQKVCKVLWQEKRKSGEKKKRGGGGGEKVEREIGGEKEERKQN